MPSGEALSGFSEDVNVSLSESLTLHQPWKDLWLPGPRKFLPYRAEDPALGLSCYTRDGAERVLCIFFFFYADTIKHLD